MSETPEPLGERQGVEGHGGDLAVAVAQAHGVTTLFTLSGAHVFPVYDAAVRATPPMRILGVRHEPTAVFAAEATGKLTRTPGLPVLTAGPGVTNGVSAITQARFSGASLVVLGGARSHPAVGHGQPAGARPPPAARPGDQARGAGLGAAIAARIARPSSKVVLLLGDGAAGMSLMDVDTLVRHDLPVVIIVGNNAGWGLEKHPMRFLYGYDVAAELAPGTSYDGVARALGAAGETVTEPARIGEALDRAFAAGVPYLANVLTDPEAAYPRSTNGV